MQIPVERLQGKLRMKAAPQISEGQQLQTFEHPVFNLQSFFRSRCEESFGTLGRFEAQPTLEPSCAVESGADWAWCRESLNESCHGLPEKQQATRTNLASAWPHVYQVRLEVVICPGPVHRAMPTASLILDFVQKAETETGTAARATENAHSSSEIRETETHTSGVAISYLSLIDRRQLSFEVARDLQGRKALIRSCFSCPFSWAVLKHKSSCPTTTISL